MTQGPYPNMPILPNPVQPAQPAGPFQPGGAAPQPDLIAPGTKPGSVQIAAGQAMPDWQQFLVFIGALVVLWFVLSAIDEAGYSQLANGFAGLIVAGALLFMGPTAITNAQALTQPRQA